VTSPELNAAARASALLELGRHEDAERMIRSALHAEPNDPILLVLLARALLGGDKVGEAHSVAIRAVAAAPDSAAALSCLAAALAAKHKYREARRTVERAVDLAPAHGDLHRQHAEILLMSGKPEHALESARRARRLAPEDARIAVVLGEALRANGAIAEADAEVTRALSLDPESARAHRAAGLLQLYRGGGEQSIVRYRQALQLDPTDASARQGLTIALKSRNRAYRWALLFETWLDDLPRGRRWAVRLGPIVLIRVLAENALTTALSLVVLIIVAGTWITEPLSTLVLMTDRNERALLMPGQRRGAIAAAGFAICAIGSFAGAASGTKALIPFGFGFGLWALVVAAVYPARSSGRGRAVIGVVGLAAVAGALGVILLIAGLKRPAEGLSAGLLVSIVPAAGLARIAR
jgi:Flp pilus assembly protein TadD